MAMVERHRFRRLCAFLSRWQILVLSACAGARHEFGEKELLLVPPCHSTFVRVLPKTLSTRARGLMLARSDNGSTLWKSKRTQQAPGEIPETERPEEKEVSLPDMLAGVLIG